MITRKSFLRRMAGVPLVPLVLPLISLAPKLSSVPATVEEAEPELEKVPTMAMAMADDTPIFNRYAPDNAGDWIGWIEDKSQSWITFIDKWGRPSAWVRDSTGRLLPHPSILGGPDAH